MVVHFPDNTIANNIAPKITNYRIIKTSRREQVQQVPGQSPPEELDIWNCVTNSVDLAQYWQEMGMSASAHTVTPRLLDNSLVSRRAAKKPLLSKK